MISNWFCRLFHGRFHEVGYSQHIELNDTINVFACQWWCPKCGNQWQVKSETLRSTGSDWDPPILVRREFVSDGTFTKEK